MLRPVLALLLLASVAQAQTEYPRLTAEASFQNTVSPRASTNDFYGSLAAPDGSFYVLTATAAFNRNEAALGHVLAGGDVDTLFGAGPLTWFVTVPLPGPGSARLTGGAVQPDGKILVVGDKNSPGVNRDSAFVARFLPTGALDTSFGSGGVLRLADFVPTAGGPLAGIAALADGRSVVYIAGQVVTLSPTGSIETSVGFGARSRPVVQADGGLLGLAESGNSSDPDHVSRLRPDGTFDLTFGVNGRAQVPGLFLLGNSQFGGASIVLGASGKFYVYGGGGGGFNNSATIVSRFTSGGVLDPSFGTNGSVELDLVPRNEEANALAVLPDGRILVAGKMEIDNRDSEIPLVLLLPDGTPDPSFGLNGVARFREGPDRSLLARSLHPQSDGTVVVGYRSSDPGTVSRNAQAGRPVLVKLRITGGTADQSGPAATEALRLEAPVPNPMRQRARLGATLSKPGHVRASVFDALGRQVAVLVDGVRPAGEVSVGFDASRLAPGVYVVRWSVGQATAVQRVTVVR